MISFTYFFHFIFNKFHSFSFSSPCLFSLCCQCGVLTTPNPSNMCVGCLRTQVDITEGIPKQSNLNFCKSCERYDTDIFVVIEINLVEQISEKHNSKTNLPCCKPSASPHFRLGLVSLPIIYDHWKKSARVAVACRKQP